jgi:hypothetical protein
MSTQQAPGLGDWQVGVEQPVRSIARLTWSRRRLAVALSEIVKWSRGNDLPVTYGCNDWSVWPTTTKGLSSPGDRDLKSGMNELLDVTVDCS